MYDENFKVTPDLYASKENRFVNSIIDVIAYYALSFIVGLLLGVLAAIGFDGPLNYVITMGTIGNLVFGIVILLLYFTIFEGLTQRTLGKYVTKTMVVMQDGSKPSMQDAFLRSLCRNIPFEAFSFLGDEGRGWHDSISNTYVVSVKRFNAKRDSANSLEQIGKAMEE